MKEAMVTSVLLACLAGAAQAGIVTFTFGDALVEGDNALTISDYMTAEFGSAVTIANAKVEHNIVEEGLPDWTGKAGDDNFVWTFGASPNTRAIDIYFNEVSITGMQFDGFVFDSTPPVDFQVRAYADDGSPDPIYSQQWTVSGDGQAILSGWIDFTDPVNHLWFSDGGRYDIGIDNLVVNVVPLPASILLDVFAVGLAVRELRKFV